MPSNREGTEGRESAEALREAAQPSTHGVSPQGGESVDGNGSRDSTSEWSTAPQSHAGGWQMGWAQDWAGAWNRGWTQDWQAGGGSDSHQGQSWNWHAEWQGGWRDDTSANMPARHVVTLADVQEAAQHALEEEGGMIPVSSIERAGFHALQQQSAYEAGTGVLKE